MPSAPAVKRWPPAFTAAPAAGAIVVVALNSESNVTPYWTTRTPNTWPCAAEVGIPAIRSGVGSFAHPKQLGKNRTSSPSCIGVPHPPVLENL